AVLLRNALNTVILAIVERPGPGISGHQRQAPGGSIAYGSLKRVIGRTARRFLVIPLLKHHGKANTARIDVRQRRSRTTLRVSDWDVLCRVQIARDIKVAADLTYVSNLYRKVAAYLPLHV